MQTLTETAPVKKKKHDLLNCLARLRHKPKEEATMFPGLRLQSHVNKSQYAAQIVGETFEKITHAIVGPKWHRLYPEDILDVRPDLGSTCGKQFIESKAMKDRRYFKIATEQLRAYQDLIEDAETGGSHLSLSYFMWSYCYNEPLSGKKRTIRDVINYITNGIVQLDIVDWSIIHRVLKQSPPNTQYREYNSWQNARKNENGDTGYKVLQISHIFMRRLRENPHNVLREELDLDPNKYDLRSNWRSRTAQIECDSIKFKTKKFRINRYIQLPGNVYAPSREILEAKFSDEIPF